MGALPGWLVLAVFPHKLLYITLKGIMPRNNMEQQCTQQFRLSQEMVEAAELQPKQELSFRHPTVTGTPESPDHNVIMPSNFRKRQRRRSTRGR
jgi:5'-3' exonuclease